MPPTSFFRCPSPPHDNSSPIKGSKAPVSLRARGATDAYTNELSRWSPEIDRLLQVTGIIGESQFELLYYLKNRSTYCVLFHNSYLYRSEALLFNKTYTLGEWKCVSNEDSERFKTCNYTMDANSQDRLESISRFRDIGNPLRLK